MRDRDRKRRFVTTKELTPSSPFYTLKVSSKTIETYRQQIMDKLDIHNIAGLTKYAVREGLTSIEELRTP